MQIHKIIQRRIRRKGQAVDIAGGVHAVISANVNEPGAYVDVATGELYRIPREALIQGSSPVIRKETLGRSRLVQVSKNPFITTFQARMLACEHNVQPNF